MSGSGFKVFGFEDIQGPCRHRDYIRVYLDLTSTFEARYDAPAPIIRPLALLRGTQMGLGFLVLGFWGLGFIWHLP